MKKLFTILGVFLLIFALYATYFAPTMAPISPLGSTAIPASGPKNDQYVVFGFAPYWNLKKLSGESLTSITHFAYFHLLINGDGTTYSKINRREEEPGFTNYKRLLAGSINRGSKPLIITVMPESQTALSSSIASSGARSKTIGNLQKIISESGATGLNIDYEPLGDTSESTKNNFTLFIKELRSRLSDTQLSISIYASSPTNPRIWDLKELSRYINYFVVMTYDYTMPSSNSAGPNSPLRGSGDMLEHDIIKNISALTQLVPSRQILLGIPFYGYEWKTVDSSKYSPVEARGSVASLERIEQMLNDKTLDLVWDRNTLTPYGIASASGQISQIYFENSVSIKLKLEFVKSANLGGIAIWALGYEGPNSWVWPLINDTLNK
ncbi:MAG: glycoside hydrolase family 18 protein [Microgenomates group bacterium]